MWSLECVGGGEMNLVLRVGISRSKGLSVGTGLVVFLVVVAE